MQKNKILFLMIVVAFISGCWVNRPRVEYKNAYMPEVFNMTGEDLNVLIVTGEYMENSILHIRYMKFRPEEAQRIFIDEKTIVYITTDQQTRPVPHLKCSEIIGKYDIEKNGNIQMTEREFFGFAAECKSKYTITAKELRPGVAARAIETELTCLTLQKDGRIVVQRELKLPEEKPSSKSSKYRYCGRPRQANIEAPLATPPTLIP